ncbi:sulfatase-like hydrolase/transferase [Pyxidicoccus parkwayensis]|uniref:Sulfatase-like hydrolase/transferase n=1 Tax=Pyxidicoccus parkwayensis TaxID=2813578 RepID=A0ABX7P4T8_9BACT|nr:sulfatase-like hydrolase/transferase [Pyxidicoccus parkwaysis]QSQ25507.1 sulfatase-like hydrolase/transferase [Pyxidicoccus parkwaysis]
MRHKTVSPPRNLLVIMVDQMRFPRFPYGPEGGFAEPLKELLGFQQLSEDNPYAALFPGFVKLQRHGVVLRNHTIASSACIPSRSTIMTGQYGTRTGVTQTDGLFKSADAAAFPWLRADGVPTLGHWFRAAGYRTHYFGKWHVSNPPEHSLMAYGFEDWELSYPEPHGSSPNNLGIYRDYGCADLACTFLRRKALALEVDRTQAVASQKAPRQPSPPAEQAPWMAVVSFANPHDIATYPALPRTVDPNAPPAGPLPIPSKHSMATKPAGGTFSFPLNPGGMTAECAQPPPKAAMALGPDKPSCQLDYSYKVGLGLAAKTGMGALRGLISAGKTPDNPEAVALGVTLASNIPFQLTVNPEASVAAFVQYYAWLHQVVDGHISRVLQTLEEVGLHEDTLVVFMSDHGEYGGAHGMMMEKWHAAYQEALHVPVVFRHPWLNADLAPRQVDALTSHVDLAPTLLSLMGVQGKALEEAREELRLHRVVPPFVGVDLTPVVKGDDSVVREPDGTERAGVLFATDDEITEPLPVDGDPHSVQDLENYAFFCKVVDLLRTGGNGKLPPSMRVPELAPGPVRQPNHVRCVRSGSWKLARYFDPHGKEADQWELYDLETDPLESHNLLAVNGPFPALAPTVPPQRQAQVSGKAAELGDLLARYEKEQLTPWPQAGHTSSVGAHQ